MYLCDDTVLIISLMVVFVLTIDDCTHIMIRL